MVITLRVTQHSHSGEGCASPGATAAVCLSAAVIDDRRFVTTCQRLRSSESATIGRLHLRRHASLNSSAPLGSSIGVVIGRNPPDHPGAIDEGLDWRPLATFPQRV